MVCFSMRRLGIGLASLEGREDLAWNGSERLHKRLF